MAAASAGNVLDLWDMNTLARVGTSIEFERTVTSTAFAPDSGRLAVGLADGDVKLVDVATHGVMPDALGGSTARVTGLAFDVSGAAVNAGRADGSTMVYSLNERTLVRRLPRYDGEGRSVAFGTHGLLVAAGSGPATVWSTEHPGSTATVLAEHADVVARRPRTDEVAVATQGRVVLADAVSPTERELVALPAEAGTVVALAFDETGETLAIATSEGGVAVFDVDEGFGALPVRLGTGITSLAFAGDDELWIADANGVRSYAAADAREQRVITDPRVRGAVAVTADPSRDRLAVATADGVLFVALGDELKTTGPFFGDRGPARAVAYSADGEMFAAALGDGAVSLFDGGSLEPLGDPIPAPGANAVAFSPEGGVLAALGAGGDVVVIATDRDVWQRSACEIAGRQLTRAEWEHFLPGMAYEPSC
jgi:WD40 repeat protein